MERRLTPRRFCRFSRSSIYPNTPAFGMTEVPDGGFCLSAFLVITEKDRSQNVLMGRLNPRAPWDHIGALDPARVERHRGGWMLPSSHLILHESPQEAAARILREQLEIQRLELSEPKIFSDVYAPKEGATLHWDLGFIFKGELAQEALPESNAWSELRFLDLGQTKKEEIARSHEDIIKYAGLVSEAS